MGREGPPQRTENRQVRPPSTVLGRAFAVLDSFSPDTIDLTLSELATRTGLPASTVHRLALALVRHGALEREGTRFRPGVRLFELAQLTRPLAELRKRALPFMEDLYEATHEIVHLGVLDGFDVVYVEKIAGHRAIDACSRVGGRNPAHCTAVGKAQLAFLPPALRRLLLSRPLAPRTPYSITDPTQLRDELAMIAKQGSAFEREETQFGVACVAAPVLDRHRRPVAGISITARADELDRVILTPAVRTAAVGLGRVLDENRRL